MRSLLTALAAVVFAASGFAPACAQDNYPSRVVKIVAGFPPGTSADIIARIYAHKLSEHFGQQFVVETQVGAASNVAAASVARAEPDGHTLFLATAANAIGVSAYKNLKFDLATDFAPVAMTSSAPAILAVNAALGVASVQELIAYAKPRPGEVSYGSSGTGAMPHLSGELFNMMAGVKLMHVPYRGTNQGLIDLVTGRIAAIFSPAPTVAGFLKDPRVKVLATTSAKRFGPLPELPTLAESGLAGFDTAIWYGFLAPKGTPDHIRKRLAEVLIAANGAADVQAQLAANGAEPVSLAPAQFGAFIREDIQKWKKIVEFAGIALE